MKNGRNKLCWCGSGKKYKHCHLDRNRSKPVKIWETNEVLSKAFTHKECLCPENLKTSCTGDIIKAHSVPKSWLKKISINGHVLGYKKDLMSIARHKGFPVPEKIGVNKASIFTGFCKFHDSNIFKEIEDSPFIGSDEQCFLLAYRAACREYFTKYCAVQVIPEMRKQDSGRDIVFQIQYQSLLDKHEEMSKLGLKNISSEKNLMDKALDLKDYSDVEYYYLTFKGTAPILSSGGVFITHDFHGNELQNLADINISPNALYYSVVPLGERFSACFVWHKNSRESCLKFIDSLHTQPEYKIGPCVISFLIEFCENNYFNPLWWAALSPNEHSTINKQFSRGINPHVSRFKDCLLRNQLDSIQWELLDISSNVEPQS
ncbi:SEC-C domain-containing protein [Kiritimatiellota bacterium B12222]|nr:SEC-C domain-containing protein [Kiritimatiellota bacterium B12222]